MMDDKTRGNSIHSGLTIEFFLNFYKIHIERLLSLKYHYLPFCHFLSVSKTFLFYARIYFLGRFFKNGNFFGKLAYFSLFLVIFRVKLSKNKVFQTKNHLILAILLAIFDFKFGNLAIFLASQRHFYQNFDLKTIIFDFKFGKFCQILHQYDGQLSANICHFQAIFRNEQ